MTLDKSPKQLIESTHFTGKDCQKTFQLKFEKRAYQPGMKEQIIEMSLHGSGTRGIARVLAINKNTVISTLKK